MAAMAGFEGMEENLRATLATFTRAKPEGETSELPGLGLASSAVEFGMYNSAVLTSPVSSVAELDRRIRASAAFFASRGLPWSFWVCQDWLDKAVRSVTGEVFDQRNMRLVVELPGMEAAGLEPAHRPPPPLEYRRVRDAETRADFARIMWLAFGISLPIARAIYESERTWESGFEGWVAYTGNFPVSTAAIVVTGSVAGVYAVGTPPAHRRQGYAEAVMRHALDHIRNSPPIQRSVLQSSEAGYLLYQRMGYRTVTRYAVFASK